MIKTKINKNRKLSRKTKLNKHYNKKSKVCNMKGGSHFPHIKALKSGNGTGSGSFKTRKSMMTKIQTQTQPRKVFKPLFPIRSGMQTLLVSPRIKPTYTSGNIKNTGSQKVRSNASLLPQSTTPLSTNAIAFLKSLRKT